MRALPTAPKLTRKGGERWEGYVKVPKSEGVVKYQYVVMSNTHRYEARIAERSVNLLGLPDGSTVDVQVHTEFLCLHAIHGHRRSNEEGPRQFIHSKPALCTQMTARTHSHTLQ